MPQSCPEARGFGSRLIVLRVRARDSKDVYRGELPTALAARTREDVALKYGHVFAVSLVFLVFEIRQNTLTQEREMQLDRYLGLTDPYLNAPEIGAIYAKVKAVDGMEPLAGAYVDRYKLTPAEAVVWSRLVLLGDPPALPGRQPQFDSSRNLIVTPKREPASRTLRRNHETSREFKSQSLGV